ncbi:ferrous iron transport protein B [Paludibacter propionicigenes WB4]|uniref:Ferrous iron transport protein B n=1 Tax=Paludibacter propionicigenes (strain DSM 17365 / JCM 13257 / WB4) TaxID=694427 RepID=E4T4G7_PALPW|nr:ferrous iron transport protein B [Paludibacter propionicigenes]ADQ79611.1 ferrous iron transport protein B [Paludibacter propionicigenes WB4]
MITNNTYLSDVKTGDEAIITKVLGHGAFRKRITEMGFVKGKKVRVIKNAPLQDPVEYEIMGYNVSLRRSEAELVEVVSLEEAAGLSEVKFEGTIDEESLKVSVLEKGKVINVALVGNPNCGKTTLFNYASGSHERVGNYSGVTVDAKEAIMKKDGYTFKIVDLPGTYSITEYSPEELYVRMHITEKMPDIVVNVIDSSNLVRNMFLTTQLIDMNIKVVVALNMYDELEKKGAKFDYVSLGEMIGIPIIPTVASKGKGVDELFEKLIDVYEDRDPSVRHIHINYGAQIEKAIHDIQHEIWKNPSITDKLSSRYVAIKLLETDKSTLAQLEKFANYEEIKSVAKQTIAQLEKEYGERSETIITDAKYGFIDGALKETYKEVKKDKRESKRELDDLLTHRFLGFPIFLFFMWLMFQATFTLGSYPMDWINTGVESLSDWLQTTMSPGALRDLLVDGIIGGVGGVIVFLPNILILFFFISLMEDTGYMARASFIMDKLMHKIGLHGKSFIPLVMGFGCNVPAIMATRTLDNKKDRILTMIITPFMSCSARLPVYVLLISAIFPANQGLVLFTIYLVGIVLAILTALVMKRIAFAKKEVPFVMELPPYRIPTLKNTSLHMWHKGQQYLKKMGNVILLASILIWALGYFPRHIVYTTDYDSKIQQVQSNSGLKPDQKDKAVRQLEVSKESERQEKSYIGQLGHAIEPVISPLGFDWKMGVSIITGLAAKEIVVSSMGILYQADLKADENSNSLKDELRAQTHNSGELKGQKVFTPLVSFAFMLFVLIYFPCVAVIAAIKKESSWGWAVFTMVYTTAMAWLVAFATYQIGSLFI